MHRPSDSPYTLPMSDDTVLLERHFDLAFAAPDGIQKLRELILTLAMQGKLVPQDPADKSASGLLRAIELEKKRLVKEGKIKEPKPLPEIKLEQVLYELPNGWEWVRLGEIIVFTNGYAFKSNLFQKTGIGIIKIGDISNGIIVKDRMDFIDESYLEDVDEKFQVKFNDMLIAMSGATTGKIGFNKLQELFLLNQRVGKIDPIIVYKNFLFNFLSTQVQKNLAISSGSAIPNLSTEQINETLIPLPPLAEQHRIVAKIDRLMARCDELEKLRAERSQKRITIHTAALDRLLIAKESDDFSTAWRFITQHFGELYSVKENVAELRKAILQLAVMGKLVPQDPMDEPASELLRAIELEKKRLVKEGKIKEPNLLPKIKPEEVPYQLPKGWVWVRLEDVVEISSGVTKGRKLNGKEMVVLPYLRVANVQRGYLDLKVIKDIEIATDEIERFKLKERDLLITEGGDRDKVGRTAIWNAEISQCIHQNHVFKARRLLAEQNEQWLEKYLNSSVARDYFANASKQTTNLASINKTQLRGCPLPLPPLAEQHRIVVKINKLMSFCDHLEQKVDAATSKQTALLNAVMAQV